MPNYPFDLPTRVDILESRFNALFASSQNRQALDTVQSGRLQIGADGGPRIVFDVGDDGFPEMLWYPSSSSSFARIVAGGSGAGIAIISEADSSDRHFFQIVQKDSFRVLHLDNSSSQADGGFADMEADFAAFGFFGTSSANENYWYHQGDRTTLVGRFSNNAANATWGMIVGGVTIGSGGSGGIITYGPTMATTMRPVACVRDGAGTGGFTWCVTASSTTSFTVSWSGSTGKEIDYCSFRT